MNQVDDKTKRTLTGYVSIFILMVMGILSSGYVSYRNFEQDYREQTENQISAIADLKVEELVDWKKEVLGDAGFLFNNPAFSSLVERYLNDPDDMEARAQLLAWLENYQEYEQYDSEYLVDTTGVDRLSIPTPLDPHYSHLKQDALKSLQSGKVTFLDVHRDSDEDGYIHISILVPIFSAKNNDQPLGVLILTINPQKYLFPSIQNWAINTTSAETLLVRREGDEVLILNESRFMENTALTLRFPLTNTDLPAVKAVLGETGVVEGLDYRGKPVLADVRSVPNSPWHLVSKMDIEEVYAPLKLKFWEMLGTIGLEIILAGATLVIFWRNQSMIFYRSKVEAAEALRESEEKFRNIVEYATDGITLTDEQGRIIEWNPAQAQIVGLPREEVINQPLADIQFQSGSPDKKKTVVREKINNLFQQLLVTGEIPEQIREQESIIQNSNGTEHIVHSTIFSIKTPRGFRLAGFSRDITEHKRFEAEILATKNKLQATLDAIPDLMFEVGLDGRLYDYHAQRADLLFAPPEEFLGKTIPEILPAATSAVCISAIQEAAEKGWSGGKEIALQLAQGERWLDLSVSLMSEGDTQNSRLIVLARDITNRKRAEAQIEAALVALREQERMLDDAQATAHLGSWSFDISTQKAAWSKEMFRLYRLSSETDQPPADDQFNKLLHPDDRAAMSNWYLACLSGNTSQEFIHRTNPALGPVRFLSSFGFLEKDGDGNPMRFLGTVQDITERKQAENALARTNLRLQSLRQIDHVLLGGGVKGGSAEVEALHHLKTLVPCTKISIIELDEISHSARVTERLTDEKSSVIWVNESVSITDLRLDKIENTEISAVKFEVDKLNPLEKQLYEEGGRSLIKAPLIVQGNIIAILMLTSEYPDFFTEEYLEIIKDVSTQLAVSINQKHLLNEIRHHAEQLEKRVQERTAEIESTHKRLELAVNAGEIGVWEIKFKENKIIWDNRMHIICGISPADFDNSIFTWWKLIHPQDVLQSQKRFREAVDATGFFSDDYRIICPDGSVRHISSSAVILYDTDQLPERMIGVNIDVTGRKEVEEAMQRANIEMARALRIKDEFLANMSHELRTPLNAVIGISESLLDQTMGVLNEKQQKYISTIYESGAHLLSLLNDILDLSKIEAGGMVMKVADVSIQAVFESSFHMVRKMAQKKKITISYEADERVQNIRGDQRLIMQMMVNLLSNAVKFTPEGGKAGVQVITDPEHNELKISVWDTGIGIAEEDMPKLFQSFVQLDSSLSREYPGTGLGLMLVMQMARLHGGNVSVQSTLNAGSRFTISLPWMSAKQAVPDREKIEKANSGPQSEKKRKGRILLIEDTESVVMLIYDYLQEKGYQVISASDGLNGIKMAKIESPDLILMDIQMPGMDGIETTRQLRSDVALLTIPIIALTALAMPSDRERCLEAGMNGYISKPIHLAELANILDQYLQ